MGGYIQSEERERDWWLHGEIGNEFPHLIAKHEQDGRRPSATAPVSVVHHIRRDEEEKNDKSVCKMRID